MRIVRSYVRHHQLASEQLVELIGMVYRVLASLGQAALSVAVPIRQSVRPEYVVCLECGFRTNPAPAFISGTRAQHCRTSCPLGFTV